MPCKPFSQQFAEAALQVRGARALDIESRIARPRADYYIKGHLGALEPPRRTGRERLGDFDRCVIAILERRQQSFGEKQLKLFRAARAALVKKITGKDVLSLIERLIIDNQLDDLLETTAIRFPRRAGKTVTSYIVSLSVALTQPDGNVICCNILGRQSREWLAQMIITMDVMQDHPEFGFDVVERDKKEYIGIHPHFTGIDVRISAFPGKANGSADNLRGMGRNVFLVIIDEYEFLDAASMEVILPITANGAALVLISSLSKGQKAGAALIMGAVWPDGRPAVRVLIWTNACHECKSRGRGNRCTHLPSEPDHFQSAMGSRRLGALMKPFPGSYERELMNVGDEPLSSPAFESVWIDALVDKSRTFNAVLYDPMVVTTVDPAGGGSSDAVVVTCAYWTPRVTTKTHVAGIQYCVILGVDYLDMGPTVPMTTVAGHVADHINACRQIDGCRDVTVLVCVENNMPGIAATVCDTLRRIQRARNLRFIYERRKRRRPTNMTSTRRNDVEWATGSRTLKENKHVMVTMLHNNLREQRIQIHEKFVVSRPAEFDDLPHPRVALEQQLRTFMRVVVPPPPGRVATGHNTIQYTGKPENKDDVTMGLSLNNFTASNARLDPSIVFD